MLLLIVRRTLLKTYNSRPSLSFTCLGKRGLTGAFKTIYSPFSNRARLLAMRLAERLVAWWNAPDRRVGGVARPLKSFVLSLRS